MFMLSAVGTKVACAMVAGVEVCSRGVVTGCSSLRSAISADEVVVASRSHEWRVSVLTEAETVKKGN